MAGQLFTLTNVAGATQTVLAGNTKAPAGTRSLPDGVNLVWGVASTTATTLSISDVVHLCSVPEGAVILDGGISGVIKTGGTVVKVGIQPAGVPTATGVSTDADLRASATLSSTRILLRFDGLQGLPYQTAAIAAATYPKSIPVVLTVVSGSVTGSNSIGFWLTYVAAGQ